MTEHAISRPGYTIYEGLRAECDGKDDQLPIALYARGDDEPVGRLTRSAAYALMQGLIVACAELDNRMRDD